MIRNLAGMAKSEVVDAKRDEPQSPLSWAFDEDHAVWQYGVQEYDDRHPGSRALTFSSLRAVASMPVVAAIHQTRISQVADYGTRQTTPFSLGWDILPKDKDRVIGPREKAEIDRIAGVIERAGGKYYPGGFEAFLRAILPDSLTHDIAAAEVIRNTYGEVWGFIPVDGSTIRRRLPDQQELEQGRTDPNKTGFIQLIGQEVKASFEPHEMMFGIRNPQTDIYRNGYGRPELEVVLPYLTHLLNAETHNASKFRNGVSSKNVMSLKTAAHPTKVRIFKRELDALVSGVRNANRTPIIRLDPTEKEELNIHRLDQSTDMEFEKWMSWLLKVVTSLYQMDPSEVNFVYGNEGQTNSMNSTNVGERIASSKERGLRPLLRAIQTWINDAIVSQINPDYRFEFAGFDSTTERERMEIMEIATRTIMKVNEARVRFLGLEPMKGGDVLLNPNWLSLNQMNTVDEFDDLEDFEDFPDPTIDAPGEAEKELQLAA